MVTHHRLAFVGGRLKHFKLLAASVNPDSQLGELFNRQLLDGLLDSSILLIQYFRDDFRSAHVEKTHRTRQSVDILRPAAGQFRHA